MPVHRSLRRALPLGTLLAVVVVAIVLTLATFQVRATPDEIGYYRLRPPVKPVTLGELAGLPTNEAAVRAVIRE